MEDPRKEALKEGLRQLEPYELRKLIDHLKAGKPLLLDRDEEGNANYSNGMLCPLAIAVGIDETSLIEGATDQFIAWYLADFCELKIYNTRGIVGEFYTTNRREDLLLASKEVLGEK